MKPSLSSPSAPPHAKRRNWSPGPFFFPTLIPLLALGLVALAAWIVMTTAGLNAAIALANRVAPVHIETAGARGSLASGASFERLRILAGDVEIDLREAHAALGNFSVGSPPRLDFDALGAVQARVTVKPGAAAAGRPGSIALPIPIALAARGLAVGELTLDAGGAPLVLKTIEGDFDLAPGAYHVRGGKLAIGEVQIALAGQLQTAAPFELEFAGEARTALREQPVVARWSAGGSLTDLALAASITGAADSGATQGQIDARLGVFDRPIVKSLRADVSDLDLRAWRRDLPLTRLRVSADLRPDAAMDRFSGPVRIVNDAAGPIDAGKLPLREMRGRIVADAASLRVTELAAQLPRGRAEGRLSATFGSRLDWQADLAFDGVDPSALHSAARPLLLDGQLRARQDGEALRISGAARNRDGARRREEPPKAPRVDARFDLRMLPALLEIIQADLKLGAGSARIAGTVGLKSAPRDPRQVKLKGAFDRIDPALLFKGADASLTGDFEADAVLAPRPAGVLRFDLRDSRALGAPLTGRGQARMTPDQRLDVDIAIALRSATFTARGGLNPPGASANGPNATAAPIMPIIVDARIADLTRWLPGARGAVAARAVISGAWNAPNVSASLRTLQDAPLRYGEHTIGGVDATASWSGPEGKLHLQAAARDPAFRANPALSLARLALTIDGTLARHTIELDGITPSQAPVALKADGGYGDGAWRGALREAMAGAPGDIGTGGTAGTAARLRLRAPAPIEIRPDGFDLGRAQLSIGGADVDIARIAVSGSTFRSSGSFAGLRPADWIARDVAGAANGGGYIAGIPGALDPLTLRGRWDVRLGAQADGELLVERSGGDLYTAASPERGLALETARLHARLNANRLDAAVAIAAQRAGTFNATMNAWLEPSAQSAPMGWRLARQRDWRLDADARFESLAWLNLLMSAYADVRLDGRLAGKIAVAGTPARPEASGALTGEALRVASVEQGLRLEHGQLAARLDGERIVLDRLRFASPPRVRPKDERAAARIDFARAGTVEASGEVRLRDFTGVVQVAAKDLPVLQLPRRWLLATGGANIEFSPKRVQLNGAMAATAGYIDFARRGLPSLSSDVVVRRGNETATAAPAAAPVAVTYDVTIGLGDALYLTGGGLDTRAEGALRLRNGARGGLLATGTIESRGGVFEGFGQRLALARGRLNFQGPIDNPGLDILALRRGLPVDVGVTLTRTVSEPLIRLYSDPKMPDQETLSWLVLGRPADASGSDNLALAQAALGLLSGAGPGLTNRLAQSLGVDELTLAATAAGSSTLLLPRRSVAGALSSSAGNPANTAAASSEIVRLGKNVGENVSIAYEQALAGTISIVQLTYRLSQQLSLIARAGTENALDLVYTWAFD